MSVFLPLLLKLGEAALGGIVGNRADAGLVRLLTGDRSWIDRVARVMATEAPVRLRRQEWAAVLKDQAVWREVVSAADQLARNPNRTPPSVRRIANMLPRTADEPADVDNVESAALLVLSVLLEASPEAHAAMAVVPALAGILSDRDRAARRHAEREARQALPLRHPRLRRPAGIPSLSPSGLLVADHGVVPFLDRAGLLARLGQWCRSPGRCAVAVVTGEGGAGKTRLGLELCRRVARIPVRSGLKRWATGLLVRSAGSEGCRAIAGYPGPRLVVIDYAEAAPAEAAELIVALDRQSSVEHPARVLLLIRHATSTRSSPPDTPWPWLARRDATVREYLLRANAEQSVAALDSAPLTLHERTAMFESACTAFSRALALNSPAIESTAWLTETQYGSPLVVSLAALTCVLEGRSTPYTATTSDLLHAVLDHEARYWDATAPVRDLDTTTLAAAASLTTVFCPNTEQEAVDLLRVIPDLSEDGTHARRLARWLAGLYPNADSPTASAGAVGAVQPDRVGEALVAQTVTDPRLTAAQLLPHGLRQVGAGPARKCFETLARAAPPRPELDLMLADLCSELANVAGQVVADRGRVAEAWIAAIVSGAQLLASRLSDAGRNDTAIMVASAAADAVDGAADEASLIGQLAEVRVIASNSLSNRLARAGRGRDALTQAKVAEEWSRRLVANQGDRLLPLLAGSLMNLSLRLREVQEVERAAGVAQEAISAYRAIATDGDPRHRADIALALNNTSVYLCDAGDFDAGLRLAEEAVALYEELSEQGDFDAPAEMGPALTNLSNRLADAGRTVDALGRADSAVAVYRRLTAIHDQAFDGLTERFPSPHRHDLAASLHNLAVRLGQAGQLVQASARCEEAIALLAQIGADRHGGDRALWLNDLAGWLADADRPGEAISAYDRAVDAYDAVAKEDVAGRDRWLSLRARARNDQGVALMQACRVSEAIEASREAWSDLFGLAKRRPENAPDAIQSLSLYTTLASKGGQLEDALIAIDATLRWLGGCPEGLDQLVAIISILQELASERHENHDVDGEYQIGKRTIATGRLILAVAPERFPQDVFDRLRPLLDDPTL